MVCNWLSDDLGLFGGGRDSISVKSFFCCINTQTTMYILLESPPSFPCKSFFSLKLLYSLSKGLICLVRWLSCNWTASWFLKSPRRRSVTKCPWRGHCTALTKEISGKTRIEACRLQYSINRIEAPRASFLFFALIPFVSFEGIA